MECSWAFMEETTKEIKRDLIEKHGSLDNYYTDCKQQESNYVASIKAKLGDGYKKKILELLKQSESFQFNGYSIKKPKLYDELNNEKGGFKKFFLSKTKTKIKDESRQVFIRFLNDKGAVCEECYVSNLGALNDTGLYIGAVDNTLTQSHVHGICNGDVVAFSLKNVCYFNVYNIDLISYCMAFNTSISPLCSDCVRSLDKRCSCCLEGGIKLLVCARCKESCYCSKECQVAHWKVHKKECKSIDKV